ncbi:MAG: histidinol-phosphatase HisJ family protein [Syntrophomonadaceae bacterium]|mgnify:CR=1 FL=1|nr:histidinol-phosphatase HisJ family protein [Syntrophomonadaceae bacterium]
MLIDYHVHALAHGEYEYSLAWIEEYLRRAQAQNLSQIGFSDHDWFEDRIEVELIKGVAARPEFDGLMVRVGIEVDYKPEREPEIRRILAQKPYDFAIGSVHHLGEWMFDHPDYKDGFLEREIEEIYQVYYSLVERAVKSNLFDIVGHLDLIKVWGVKPTTRQENYFLKPLLHVMRKAGTVVEINTGGLRKPVREMYPSEVLLRDLFAHNIPITFGSDAHHPEELGSGLYEALQTAWRVGYRKASGFARRQSISYPLSEIRRGIS